MLDWLPAVVYTNPLGGQSSQDNGRGAHLEIVVTGMKHHPHVVNVRVEVVQKLSVVDVGQLVTGLHNIKSKLTLRYQDSTHGEKIFANFVYGSGFLHPNVHHLWLISYIRSDIIMTA